MRPSPITYTENIDLSRHLLTPSGKKMVDNQARSRYDSSRQGLITVFKAAGSRGLGTFESRKSGREFGCRHAVPPGNGIELAQKFQISV